MTQTPPGETAPTPPRATANPAPPRRAQSVRRTTSIDVQWLDRMEGERILHGRSRDARTGGDGALSVLAEAAMEARLPFDKTLTALSGTAGYGPTPARLGELVGQRAGGHLRLVMAEVLPELIARGDPLYLLLDDISGTSLVCSWAWSLWQADWLAHMQRAIPDEQFRQMMDERADVCWGLQRGHSGLNPDRGSISRDAADAGELRNPADPEGWHAFPALAGVSMRRARRIEVWRDAASGLVHIDSAFQDSAPRPDGTRAALHEYRLTATADPATLELLSLSPEPRVLPFHECPGAVTNAMKLVGTPLPRIRSAVLSELRGPAGCTHLNDALRALAEVPGLVEQLD